MSCSSQCINFLFTTFVSFFCRLLSQRTKQRRQRNSTSNTEICEHLFIFHYFTDLHVLRKDFIIQMMPLKGRMFAQTHSIRCSFVLAVKTFLWLFCALWCVTEPVVHLMSGPFVVTTHSLKPGEAGSIQFTSGCSNRIGWYGLYCTGLRTHLWEAS